MVSAIDTFSGSAAVRLGRMNVCESAWAAVLPNRAGNGCMLNAILAAWKTVTFHSPSQYRPASPAWNTAVPPPASTFAFIRPSLASWWMKVSTFVARV